MSDPLQNAKDLLSAGLRNADDLASLREYVRQAQMALNRAPKAGPPSTELCSHDRILHVRDERCPEKPARA